MSSRAKAGPSSTGGLPGGGNRLSPAVTNPKDGRGIDPCTVLTTEQVVAIGADPTTGEDESSAGLAACGWEPVEDLFSFGITLDVDRPETGGLEDTYLKCDDFAVFEPTAVGGHPAVNAEYSDSDDCSIYLGLSDA